MHLAVCKFSLNHRPARAVRRRIQRKVVAGYGSVYVQTEPRRFELACQLRAVLFEVKKIELLLAIVQRPVGNEPSSGKALREGGTEGSEESYEHQQLAQGLTGGVTVVLVASHLHFLISCRGENTCDLN